MASRSGSKYKVGGKWVEPPHPPGIYYEELYYDGCTFEGTGDSPAAAKAAAKQAAVEYEKQKILEEMSKLSGLSNMQKGQPKMSKLNMPGVTQQERHVFDFEVPRQGMETVSPEVIKKFHEIYEKDDQGVLVSTDLPPFRNAVVYRIELTDPEMAFDLDAYIADNFRVIINIPPQ